MEIAQVLYDVQFVAYLRKTFLEDTNQLAKGGNGGPTAPSNLASPLQQNIQTGGGHHNHGHANHQMMGQPGLAN